MSVFEQHHAFLFPLSLRPDELVIDEQIDQARYRRLVEYYEKEQVLSSDNAGRIDDGSSSLSANHRRKRSAHEFSDFDLIRLAFRDHRIQLAVSSDARSLTCQRKYRQITTRNDRRYLCDQIQNLRRVVRDYLFAGSSHLDMVNCHYCLAIGFVRRMYPDDVGRFDVISDFIENRVRYLNDLRLFTGERCSVDECKRLVASFLMGGSLMSWSARLPCVYDQIPSAIRNLHSCVTDLRSFLTSKPEMNVFRPISYSRMDAFECTNSMLYLLFTTLESQHILVLRRVIEEELRIPVRALIHDAIEIEGHYVGMESDRSSEFLVSLRPRLHDAGFYDEVKLAFKDKTASTRQIEEMFTEQRRIIEQNVVPAQSAVPLSLSLSDVPPDCLNPTYLNMKRRLEGEFGLCRVMTKYYMKVRDMEGQWSYGPKGFDPKEMKTILENYRVRLSEKREEAFFAIWTRDPNMKTYSHAVLYPSKNCPIVDALNLWNGFAVERFVVSDEERKSSDYVALKEFYFQHLRYLVDDDSHLAYWMIFLAHLFQHPDQKPGICMVLQSDTEGVGKGFFESILRCMVGEDLSWYTNTPEEDLFGSFQDIMYHAILGVLDESNVTKAKSVEKFKALITNETISQSRKYQATQTTRDFHRFILTTNQTMPSVISATDRRFMISRTRNAAISADSINKLARIKQSRVVMRLIYEDLMRMVIPIDFKFSTSRPTSDFYKEIQSLSRPTTLVFFDSWMSERISLALNACPATSSNFIPPNASSVPSSRFLLKLPKPCSVRIGSKEFYEAYTEFMKTSGFKTECVLSLTRFSTDLRNHLNVSAESNRMDHGIWYHKVLNRNDAYYQKHVWDMELNELIAFLIQTGALKSAEYESILS